VPASSLDGKLVLVELVHHLTMSEGLLGRQDVAPFITGVLDNTSSSLLFGPGFNHIDFAIGCLGGSLEYDGSRRSPNLPRWIRIGHPLRLEG
jgi:hypothetical protein